jgi:hypothetical protein
MATNANLNKQPIGLVKQTLALSSGDKTLVDTDSGTTILFDTELAAAQTVTLPSAGTAGLNFRFIWSVSHDANFDRIIQAPAGELFIGNVLYHDSDAATIVDTQPDASDDRILTLQGESDVEPGSWVDAYADGTSWVLTGCVSAVVTFAFT